MKSKKQKLKQLRNAFREGVFNRDGHKCVMCDNTEDLDAHHITDRHEMPNDGYVLSNGITLCPQCHWDAESYHITGGKKCKDGFWPKELYEKINSSYEKAVEDSENIK